MSPLSDCTSILIDIWLIPPVPYEQGSEGHESAKVESKSDGVSLYNSNMNEDESKSTREGSLPDSSEITEESIKDASDSRYFTQAVDVSSSSSVDGRSPYSVDVTSSCVDFDEPMSHPEDASAAHDTADSLGHKATVQSPMPDVSFSSNSCDSSSSGNHTGMSGSPGTEKNDSLVKGCLENCQENTAFNTKPSQENISINAEMNEENSTVSTEAVEENIAIDTEPTKENITVKTASVRENIRNTEQIEENITIETKPVEKNISVTTEPIEEALKEILRVSPGRTSLGSGAEDTQRAERPSSCSPSLRYRSQAENNSAALHSIALDDPAIVTSSDVFTNNSAEPCDGDGSAHIMNLLRKSLQNDLANKGDGDKVFENTSPEKPREKVSVGRTRADSSTSTSTGCAETELADGEVMRREDRPVREMLVRRQASQTNMPASDKPVLETLTFGTSLDEGDGIVDNEEESAPKKVADRSCPCPLCDRSFPAENKEDVLAHLVLVHKFVIADVNFIGNLSVYLRYWKERLKTRPVSEFCSKIVTNTGVKDEAEKEEFYLLCDALPEDKDIREQLQRKKLEQVLAQQQREREETKFCRQCLFCRQTFCGNRAVLFDHLLRDHMFHMGQPDNLVFTDELFDLIQFKLDSQLCLFCEKSFKDKPSLREHMRKKQHRKINPKNKEYDRFYIINYMEMGKNWESLQHEDARLVKNNDGSEEEDEWADWNEESQDKVVCLFCDSASSDQEDLHKHMKENHTFDLQEVNQKLQLNFYQKVKLINFIRRQVYHKTCYGCQESFPDKPQLTQHMTKHTDHINKLPEASIWDQSQYFFPTYEDDNLLCHLDDDDEGAAGDALGVMVYAEDIPVSDSTILRDTKLHRELLRA